MAGWQIISLIVLGVVLVGGTVLACLNETLFEWLMLGGLSIALVAALVVFIPAANRDQARWEAWCVSQGGRVDDHTSTTVVTTVSGDGKPGVGVGSETTYYCLSADGGVLDVR